MKTHYEFKTHVLTHWELYVKETARLLHVNTGYPINSSLAKVAKFYDVVINEFIKQTIYNKDALLGLGIYNIYLTGFAKELGTFYVNKTRRCVYKSILAVCPLFRVLSQGNGLSKKISSVVVIPSFRKVINEGMTNSYIVSDCIFRDYLDEVSDPLRHEKVYIDAVSLRSARSGFKKMHSVRLANYLLQVHDVFGYLPHIPNESNFGRLYYRCINLQGASKEVRKAALPNAIEVDIDSCSNEFLMQQANEHRIGCDYLKLFSLEKTNIRVEITKKVFDVDESDANFYCNSTPECECDFDCDCKPVTDSYLKIIKQCITSIGFGARIIDYKDNAINTLLKDDIHRARFLNHEFITGYSADMKNITTAVVKAHPKLHDLPYLHSDGGKLSPSKLMAHQFQHFERYAMDTAFSGFDKYVKLRIHDGRYIEGMSPDDLNVVERRFADMKLTVSVE
jgi:hypothetical protein